MYRRLMVHDGGMEAHASVSASDGGTELLFGAAPHSSDESATSSMAPYDDGAAQVSKVLVKSHPASRNAISCCSPVGFVMLHAGIGGSGVAQSPKIFFTPSGGTSKPSNDEKR